ncbi:MAG: nuclear transport factor 2 family protein [Polyangiales bacterium]
MSVPTSETLEDRIARLEAIEAIKVLKARYWYCCDQKDVEGVRDCFAEGEVLIHYDGPVGLVNHRDGLYEVFRDVACQMQIIEMHHGGPPQIEVQGPDTARARWGLVYHLMNTELRTVSVVGGYYDDAYARVEGEWRITKARFEVCSAVTYGFKNGDMRILHASASLPTV